MQQIADYGHDTAENILWHPQENALYWLDIPTGQLFRGHFPDPKCFDEFQSQCILQMDEAIGGFVFAKSGGFLLFASEGRIYQYSEQGPRLYAQIDLVPSRFNDVFALPGGRFVLCGTMPSGTMPNGQNADSRLLLFDVELRKAEVVLENLKLANGMGLSPDQKYLYFADTRDFAVYRFAVQKEMDWQTPHKLLDFTQRSGRPDGLCVDTSGRIWVAETGAGIVTCFSPKGLELAAFAVGTDKITSCCLGGSSKDILFVSTQGGTQKGGGKAGGIFAQDMSAVQNLPDVRGQDEFFCDYA